MATAISDEARAKNNEFLRRGKREHLPGPDLLDAEHQPGARPALGPRHGGLRRRSVPGGAHGGAVHQGAAGQRPEVPESGGHRQALRGAQRTRIVAPQLRRRGGGCATCATATCRISRRPIREGGAYSVMCAYNRVDGDPACASPRLLGDILRKQWGFSGYVVSDCGAVGDIFRGHNVAPSMAAAVGARREGRHGPGLRQRIPLADSGAGTEADRGSGDRCLGAPPADRALPAGHVRPAGARAVRADSVHVVDSPRRTRRWRWRPRANPSCC